MIERSIVSLAYLVEELRQELLDSDPTPVVGSSHDEHWTETLD